MFDSLLGNNMLLLTELEVHIFFKNETFPPNLNAPLIRRAPSYDPFITFWPTKMFACTALSIVQVLKMLDIIENIVFMELTDVPLFL